jgi:hypothetical protein
MQSLRLKGQTRIHMNNERDSRRREILNVILSMAYWECLILQSKSTQLRNAEARQHLLILASTHHIWRSIRHITIEDSTDRIRDKKTLTWIKSQGVHEFEFDFLPPAQNECLWIADALAWAYSKGGDWRKTIRSRVTVETGP